MAEPMLLPLPNSFTGNEANRPGRRDHGRSSQRGFALHLDFQPAAAYVRSSFQTSSVDRGLLRQGANVMLIPVAGQFHRGNQLISCVPHRAGKNLWETGLLLQMKDSSRWL